MRCPSPGFLLQNDEGPYALLGARRDRRRGPGPPGDHHSGRAAAPSSAGSRGRDQRGLLRLHGQRPRVPVARRARHRHHRAGLAAGRPQPAHRGRCTGQLRRPRARGCSRRSAELHAAAGVDDHGYRGAGGRGRPRRRCRAGDHATVRPSPGRRRDDGRAAGRALSAAPRGSRVHRASRSRSRRLCCWCSASPGGWSWRVSSPTRPPGSIRSPPASCCTSPTPSWPPPGWRSSRRHARRAPTSTRPVGACSATPCWATRCTLPAVTGLWLVLRPQAPTTDELPATVTAGDPSRFVR